MIMTEWRSVLGFYSQFAVIATPLSQGPVMLVEAMVRFHSMAQDWQA